MKTITYLFNRELTKFFCVEDLTSQNGILWKGEPWETEVVGGVTRGDGHFLAAVVEEDKHAAVPWRDVETLAPGVPHQLFLLARRHLYPPKPRALVFNEDATKFFEIEVEDETPNVVEKIAATHIHQDHRDYYGVLGDEAQHPDAHWRPVDAHDIAPLLQNAMRQKILEKRCGVSSTYGVVHVRTMEGDVVFRASSLLAAERSHSAPQPTTRFVLQDNASFKLPGDHLEAAKSILKGEPV